MSFINLTPKKTIPPDKKYVAPGGYYFVNEEYNNN